MRSFVRRLCGLAFLFMGLIGIPEGRGASVHMFKLPLEGAYENATSPGAVRFACAPAPHDLVDFFFDENLPFRTDLIRNVSGAACHVFYRPTLPGFKAFPDNYEAKELITSGDPFEILARNDKPGSHSGEIVRSLVQGLRNPVELTVVLNDVRERETYDRAVREYFGNSGRRAVVLGGKGPAANVWTQDYIKAGTCGGETRILIPHRLYEGRPGAGADPEDLLEDMARDRRIVRSNLAWEGGDLQFTLHPQDERRLVLYYGGVAKSYWGRTLTPAEYEYILRLEFGADAAVDLSNLAPHVDYFVAFVPQARLALVSDPVAGNPELARASIGRLLERFHPPGPPLLLQLREALSGSGREIDRASIARLLEESRAAGGNWVFRADTELLARIEKYVRENCPDRGSCFSADGQKRMLERDSRLFSDWVRAARDLEIEQDVIAAHLNVVESQINDVPDALRARIESKIGELQRLGFRVLRVPRIGAELDHEAGWPGISYVNGFVGENKVFVPEFGLGEIEQGYFEKLERELPAGYSVVSVASQSMLVRNGGIHCLVGIVRRAPQSGD